MRFFGLAVLLVAISLAGCGGGTDRADLARNRIKLPATPNAIPDGVFGERQRETALSPNPRPLTHTLVETVNSLRGDGLPLKASAKAGDPAILFKVRGDGAMLLWRYRF